MQVPDDDSDPLRRTCGLDTHCLPTQRAHRSVLNLGSTTTNFLLSHLSTTGGDLKRAVV